MRGQPAFRQAPVPRQSAGTVVRSALGPEQLVVTAALRQQYQEILIHQRGSRLGLDPEELHAHRVAIRRVRAMLSATRSMIDYEATKPLRRPLRRATRALAEVRDLDAMLTEIRRCSAQLGDAEARAGADGLIDLLRSRRWDAHERLCAELAQPWYPELLDALQRFVVAIPFTGSGALAEITLDQHRRAARHVSDLSRADGPRLHRIRKAVKRSRAAAELGSAAGIPGCRSYSIDAARLQDALGVHQDAVFAMTTLEAIGTSGCQPAMESAIVALADNQQRRKADARRITPEAWRRLDHAAALIDPGQRGWVCLRNPGEYSDPRRVRETTDGL